MGVWRGREEIVLSVWWFSPYRLRLSRGPDEQGGLVLASATGKQQASIHQDGWLGWGVGM